MKLLISHFLLILAICSCKPDKPTILKNNNPEVTAARQVLMRVLGTKSETIDLDIEAGSKNDSYTYFAKDGVLTVRGSSTNALTRGVYDYLKQMELGMLDWSGPLFSIPEQWPDAPLTENTTPYPIRHAYNAVTSGYTSPYWTWERWEQELDWQAMHGFNVLMAPIATEAIAIRVWKKLGLTQEEIDEFYVGPAHMPWLRMGCIQQVNGPAPDQWHEDQIALQHQILDRMVELGMEPVVQSFAGFVPKGLQRVFPDIAIHETLWNAGFPEEQRPSFIAPDSDLFAKISKMYMEEWQSEFGKARYFLVDSFNELQLPESERPVTELLAEYGAKTFDIVKSANPEAVWVIQGWMFAYQRYIWNPDTVEALFSKVPADRVLILDYANDYNNNWEPMNAFNGKQWVYGFVPNMGGKTAYTGDLSLYASGAATALSSPNNGNLVGFTMSGEGLENNAVVYELLTDVAWANDAINLDSWLKNYSINRYGGYPEEMSKAWSLLRQSAYSELEPHPQFGWQLGKTAMGTVNNDLKFHEAAKAFLACADQLENSPAYRFDAIEIAALSLGLKADEWFAAAAAAYKNGDSELGEKSGNRGLELLAELDRLMESHPLNRLDRWVQMARSHGKSEDLKDYYEKNAKYIITVWGPPVNDYSCRVWSGLVRDFYLERMRLILDSLKHNTTFESVPWEVAWTEISGISEITPYENPIQTAKVLVKRALEEPMP